MRACRALGISTVAVYSEADRNAIHIRSADEAVYIGAAPSRDSYLRMDRTIEAAQRTGAEAIHPGYGFLSENADFAEACKSAGIVFIGPSPESIRKMGLKNSARGIASSAGVPVVPGYDGDNQSDSRLRAEALRIGLPVLFKASAGGGGRGMRVVQVEEELEEAIASARREAASAFGDGTLLIEKFIPRARHVEVQIIGDRHGNIVHLFERDCSLQRRHQKIIEECPSPSVDADLRLGLGEAAISIGRAIEYINAGTVEFILDQSGAFYFIEVNTRLQVEHPVTEMVAGVDLVGLQIAVAEGRELPFTQDDLRIIGHAFEARLYAEDPANGFLPSTGRVQQIIPPYGIEGVRVDSGIEQGSEVGIHYDPLLAKFIAFGEDREAARRKLIYALRSACISGVKTNRDFLIELLDCNAVRAGTAHTGTIAENLPDLLRPLDEWEKCTAAALTAIWLFQSCRNQSPILAALPPSFRNNPYRDPRIDVLIGGEKLGVSCRFVEKDLYCIEAGDKRFDARLCGWRKTGIDLEMDGVLRSYNLCRDGDRFDWHSAAGAWTVEKLSRFPGRDHGEGEETANAPMPGQVLKILVEPGRQVERGDALIILEAMKMEQCIRASVSGVVESIMVEVGAVVSPGDLLVHIAPAD
jgi:acetyl/propionyl-CoA carboxylase alpha subunit